MNKRIFSAICIIAIFFFAACGGDENKPTGKTDPEQPGNTTTGTADYDPQRGEGKYDETNVSVGALNTAMATKGKSIADTKCFSCHKVSGEKLVGPGWKDVTTRHTPHWIMNFITNPSAMIDKDPKVQAQLEICLVRMPNQNLDEEEARSLLEFMRQNDGVK